MRGPDPDLEVPPRIFLSYRRDDSGGHAGRLFDRLSSRFGPDQVFMDVVALTDGVDFVDAIHQAVGSCSVVLVVIGPRWVTAADAEGRRRLDLEEDFVRLEVMTALERRIPVIPVLVGDATMPSAADLPPPLKRLARRQARSVSDARFPSDCERLGDAIELLLQIEKASEISGAGEGSIAGEGRVERGDAAGQPDDRPQGSRRTVTAMAMRTATSSAIRERLDPEAQDSLAGRLFDDMRDVVRRHGGIVEGSLGDVVMAVFGMPIAHEDDAVRAVRAAFDAKDVVERLSRWAGSQWGLTVTGSFGVDTGEVLARIDADGETLFSGDPMHRATQLLDAAGVEDVLVGETTYRLVRDQFEGLPVMVAEGEADIPAWRIASLEPPIEPPRRLSAPMVGRDMEVGLLAQAYRRAEHERACHLFTLVGEAGVGKSRLVDEFVDSVRDEATILRGPCLSYGEGITYWPLRLMIKQAAGITEMDSADTVRHRLDELLASSPERDVIHGRIAQLLGVEDASSSTEETFLSFRSLFQHLGRQRPLVLLFEDIHWAEQTLLDLIEYLADWLRGAPVLLLCPARHQLFDIRPGWGGGKLNATTISLDPLSEEQSGQLIEHLVGRVKLPAEVRQRVVATAEGNPFFVEETLEMLIDDGALIQRDDSWIPARDLADLEIPPTIAALLTARIDQLDEEERDVFQRASIIGREFYHRAVTDLCPPALKPRVARELTALMRRDLVRSFVSPVFVEEDSFQFRHMLLRDAAYGALPKQVRADLHERFSAWVQSVVGDRIVENEEIIGYHLEQAFLYRREWGPPDPSSEDLARRANRALAGAARRAVDRGDMRAAANLLERASAMPTDQGRAELLVELGEVLYHTGDLVGAQRAVDEALEEADTRPDDKILARATIVGLMVRALTDPEGWPGEATKETDRLIGVLQTHGDEHTLVRLWNVRHQVGLMRGRYDEAADASRHAAEHARNAGSEREEIENLALWAATAAFGSTPVAEGLRRCEDVLERARAYPTVEAQVLFGLAAMKAMDGDFDAARTYATRGKALWESMGMMLSVASSAVQFMSFVEILAGDLRAGEAELRWGYSKLGEMGEESVRASLAGSLAGVLIDLGEREEAERFATAAEEASASDDVDAEVLWRRARARLLAQGGDIPRATVLVRDALARAEETDDLDLIAGTRVVLAEVVDSAGDADEGRAVLRAAVEDYERKGNRIAAEKVRQRIGGE